MPGSTAQIELSSANPARAAKHELPPMSAFKQGRHTGTIAMTPSTVAPSQNSWLTKLLSEVSASSEVNSRLMKSGATSTGVSTCTV